MTFDSLTFARRLKTAGFTEAQAEALADANREMVVHDLATTGDVAAIRGDIGLVRGELKTEIAAVRTDMTAMEQRLQAAIEAIGLRLTIRLGVMIGTAIVILGAILRLH
jgi:hypothetical protein